MRPRIHGDHSDCELAEHVEEAVHSREQTARREVRAAGRTFLGAKAVVRQSITDRPKTAEPRRELSPRVAARNKWRRIEALRRLKWFVDEYRQAYGKLRAGIRDVLFPAGTYALRLLHGVPCAFPG